MILVIDNYDSFTYNLVQYLGELGAQLEIYRNDKITVDRIASRKMKPAKILISPGPGQPNDELRQRRPCGTDIIDLGVFHVIFCFCCW